MLFGRLALILWLLAGGTAPAQQSHHHGIHAEALAENTQDAFARVSQAALKLRQFFGDYLTHKNSNLLEKFFIDSVGQSVDFRQAHKLFIDLGNAVDALPPQAMLSPAQKREWEVMLEDVSFIWARSHFHASKVQSDFDLSSASNSSVHSRYIQIHTLAPNFIHLEKMQSVRESLKNIARRSGMIRQRNIVLADLSNDGVPYKKSPILSAGAKEFKEGLDGLSKHYNGISVPLYSASGFSPSLIWHSRNADYSSIHILGHGNAGAAFVNKEAIGSSEFDVLKNDMAPSAALAFYGCNIAADQSKGDGFGKAYVRETAKKIFAKRGGFASAYLYEGTTSRVFSNAKGAQPSWKGFPLWLTTLTPKDVTFQFVVNPSRESVTR